jgi:hypothetical protein
MNDINNEQIAPRRKLNFDAAANPHPINDQALAPIDTSRSSTLPSAYAAKFFIDKPPDGRPAIGINRFTDEQGKPSEQLSQLIGEGLES